MKTKYSVCVSNVKHAVVIFLTYLLSPPRRLCFHRGYLFVFCLFVCKHDYVKTTQPILTKFGPMKKRLDFGGKTDPDQDPEFF